jgi:hypothetical protein
MSNGMGDMSPVEVVMTVAASPARRSNDVAAAPMDFAGVFAYLRPRSRV